MEKFKCSKCGVEVETEGKCTVCKQKAVSTSYLVFGIVFVSVAFILGIILGALVPTSIDLFGNLLEEEASFNVRIMFITWEYGVGLFILYFMAYNLFRKLDCIIEALKK